MRKEGNRPLSVPKKRKENDIRNHSATRNSVARRNPIAVPFDPPSNGPKSIVGKMKSSLESTSSPSTLVGSSSGGLNKVGDRRKTRHSIKNFERTTITTPPPVRQSSRSLTNKRKEEEIIEIDSDQDNCESGEETPKPTVRKRRLIRPPSSDSDDDEDETLPSTGRRRKIVVEDNDEVKGRVANKLKNERIEQVRQLQLKQQQHRQAELDAKLALERENQRRAALMDDRLKQQTFERAKELAIKRERERGEERARMETEMTRARILYEHQLRTAASPSLSSFTEKPSSHFHEKIDIPPKRTEPTLSPAVRSMAASISKSPTNNNNNNNILESSPFKTTFFNLPTALRIAREKITKSIYQQPSSFKEEKEIDIKSQPIVGDVFDFEGDDFKADSPSNTNKTSTTSSPKKKPVEEPVKITLPRDPIDDDPLKPIGSDKHLLTYPFEGKKSVTVYERDLTRLDEDQYLNDTLLDVFPKIWDDDYPTSKLIHTFSSFFYTKLAGDGNSVNYDKIGRWTANTNIFEKTMIIIPVAQNYHWYLIVVTNPSRCISNAEVYGLVNKDEESAIDIDYIEEDRPPRVGRWRNQVPSGAKLNPKKAYIMILDSLGGMKKETCTNITEYLKQEAMVKLNIQEDEFIEPEFVSAHCPTQKNFVDCGVFCLHYMRSLYQDPRRMMKVLYNHQKDDKGWDPENTLPVYRQILRRILKKKMVKYREYLTGKLAQEVGFLKQQ